MYFYVYGCAACMCVCVPCVCCAWYLRWPEKKKGMCGPQKLELKITMRGYVGAGNGALVFWKNKQCSKLLSHLTPNPYTADWMMSSIFKDPCYVSRAAISTSWVWTTQRNPMVFVRISPVTSTWERNKLRPREICYFLGVVWSSRGIWVSFHAGGARAPPGHLFWKGSWRHAHQV